MSAILAGHGITGASSKYSQAEWETRVNLAACYRLMPLYGMSDLVYNHITARIPGTDDELLINPYGFMYDEITASSLVKINLAGDILDNPNEDYGIQERTRLVADLGKVDAMNLRSHGLLVASADIAEAFNTVYWLEMACRAQVDAMASGAKLIIPPDEVVDKTHHLYQRTTRRPFGLMEWPAMLRYLDRKNPGYKD